MPLELPLSTLFSLPLTHIVSLPSAGEAVAVRGCFVSLLSCREYLPLLILLRRGTHLQTADYNNLQEVFEKSVLEPSLLRPGR